MKTMNILQLVLIAFLVNSCASKSRPTLYPNAILKERGNEKAQADINQCMSDAETFLKSPEGKKVASGGSYGTTIGTSVGIGIGSGGDVGVGVGVGAHEPRMSSMDVKRSFVNQCLTDKGYQVLAWD